MEAIQNVVWGVKKCLCHLSYDLSPGLVVKGGDS